MNIIYKTPKKNDRYVLAQTLDRNGKVKGYQVVDLGSGQGRRQTFTLEKAEKRLRILSEYWNEHYSEICKSNNSQKKTTKNTKTIKAIKVKKEHTEQTVNTP